MQRAILHIDMDAFYASVEVLDDPSLRGKPVIVGGTPAGRGVVTAASYEAREFGVHSAMPAGRARRLCPDGIFLRGRMNRYVEISREIQAIFREFTDLVEPLSLDEAFLDVTGSRRLFGDAEQIGRHIKRRILDEVGLVASVGVAHNKFLAKLGSDLDKPDGFFVFTPENTRGVLRGLPVGRLWGVGRVTRKKLEGMGIETVADLLAYPAERLVTRLGDHAEHLLALALGQDDRPVVSGRGARSIGHEVTFDRDIGNADQLQGRLDEMAARVARRLRKQGLLARTVVLKARYADFTTKTRSQTLPEPTDSNTVLRNTARTLLRQRLGRRGRPLRLLGVTAANLEHPVPAQAELFAPVGPDRQRKLDNLLDAVQGRFGESAIRRGARPHRDEPDDEDSGRHEPGD